jgi:hypothetical protein
MSIKDAKFNPLCFSARKCFFKVIYVRNGTSNRTEESPKWHKIVEYYELACIPTFYGLLEHYSCHNLGLFALSPLLMFDLLRIADSAISRQFV